MKAKKFYPPSEYITLLEFCTRTTNIGTKAESILRTICQRYICNDNISARQYEALHNIAVMCADSHFAQSVLRSLKFDGPVFEIPGMVLDGEDLRFPYQSQTITEETSNVPSSVRTIVDGSATSASGFASDHPVGEGRSALPNLEEGSQETGGKLDGSSSGSPESNN